MHPTAPRALSLDTSTPEVHISPFAIPPDTADTSSCNTLSVAELLSHLNGIFGTQVSIEPSLATYLTECSIEEKWDLGKVSSLVALTTSVFRNPDGCTCESTRVWVAP